MEREAREPGEVRLALLNERVAPLLRFVARVVEHRQRPPSSSSASSGTTAFTRPIASASCASYWRQRYQISRAFFVPTSRASIDTPKPPSNEPTRGPVCPKRALSAAIVGLQITRNTCPP